MKILMIGLGGIGQRHTRNLRTLFGNDVEILAYRVRGQSEALTDKLQIEAGSNLEHKYQIRVFKDLDRALAERPQAAFICNPSSLHVASATAAAHAGCHLFLEKPLSHSLEGLSGLIELATSKSLVSLVGYQLRFHPCLQRVRSVLNAGLIGRVLSVRAEVGEYLPGWHVYEDYRQMYASRDELGGGVILSQIHEMDYLYWLFGLPGRIFAMGGHLSSLEINVEDVASILMDCGGVPVHLHQDYVQRPPSRTLQIIGDTGKIMVDFRTASFTHFDADGKVATEQSFHDFERNEMFMSELRHFFACIKGDEKSLVSLSDGVQSLKMALAAKESIRTGRVVHLA